MSIMFSFNSMLPIVACALLLPTSVVAGQNATVFPPTDCSASEQRVITWQDGTTSTHCATGQQVLDLALSDCEDGQVVTREGGKFVCSNPSGGNGSIVGGGYAGNDVYGRPDMGSCFGWGRAICNVGVLVCPEGSGRAKIGMDTDTIGIGGGEGNGNPTAASSNIYLCVTGYSPGKCHYPGDSWWWSPNGAAKDPHYKYGNFGVTDLNLCRDGENGP